MESFNGRFRDECLNENWFSDLADAREKIAHWKQDYNERRPHSSLQYRTPVEFAAQSAASFYRNDVGQEASNAGPLPHTPIPAAEKGTWGERSGESLIIPGLKTGAGHLLVHIGHNLPACTSSIGPLRNARATMALASLASVWKDEPLFMDWYRMQIR